MEEVGSGSESDENGNEEDEERPRLDSEEECLSFGFKPRNLDEVG